MATVKSGDMHSHSRYSKYSSVLSGPKFLVATHVLVVASLLLGSSRKPFTLNPYDSAAEYTVLVRLLRRTGLPGRA